MLRPIFGGAGGAILLMGLYLALISLAESLNHALAQFRTDATWVTLVALGFGTQVGLYLRIRQLTRSRPAAAARALTGAGTGTSTAGMIACCAHHLADVAPFLGLAGATAFLSQYRLAFIGTGLAVNLAGIVFSLKTLRRVQAHLRTAGTPAWHSEQAVREETGMARDPVCGMEVSEQSAAATAVYQGRTYYFCAPGCKRAFEKDPQHYLEQQEQPGHGSHRHGGHGHGHGGHGCCH